MCPLSLNTTEKPRFDLSCIDQYLMMGIHIDMELQWQWFILALDRDWKK